MAKKVRRTISCTVEFSEGALERITNAFVDLYYAIKDGIHEGPLPEYKLPAAENNKGDKTA